MTLPPDRAPRAAVHSVGCKLNQYEAELLRQMLQDLGYVIVPFDGVADVYLLNTCTVTSRTDRECRRLARGARRRNPQALVVLTGCYAEVAEEDLQRQGLGQIIAGNRGKLALPARIEAALGRGPAPDFALQVHELPLLREFSGHSRAFLKVQEGCAGGCAYCVIARARGPERSVPRERVVAQARLLGQRHAELVLIGTHLGRWGRDLEGEAELADLVEDLGGWPEVRRLRLSSLEPLEVTPRLIAQVSSGGRCLPPDSARPAQGKLCRHLHLPLQSGCDSVLARMGRPYDTATYAGLVRELKRRQPGLCLGADVMVGFPGETEEEFAATVAFLEDLPLSYLHVFTYSPRPGTPAVEMPQQVPPPVKKGRNHVLRALSEYKRRQFAESQVGERLEVIVEQAAGRGDWYGLSDNYLEIELETPYPAAGELVDLPLTRAGRVRLPREAEEADPDAESGS